MNFLSKVKNMVSTPSSSTEASTGITVASMDSSDLISTLSIVQRQSKDDSSLVDICVSVHPPSGEKVGTVRGPSDICCVIDISGSMNSSASVSESEDAGLSVLDVVKHAVNTIIQSLNMYDRLSVVTFSDNAKVLFANLEMNTAGKTQAKRMVDALRTEGRTNLWAGLLRGMEILNAAIKDGTSSVFDCGKRNTSIFLLTDGVPNVNPDGGHIRAMQRFKDDNSGHYPGSIHAFGFGYSLKSALLHEIAIEGSGTYNFIPDSGFVGTAFVNTLANQLTSYGTQTTLSLQLLNEDSTLVEESLSCNGSHMATSWGVNINVGNLLLGQQRDFVVQVRLPTKSDTADNDAATPLIEAVMKYKPLFVLANTGGEEGEICVTQTELDVTSHGALNLDTQLFRTTLVRDLTNGYSVQNAATEAELTLIADMQTWCTQTSAALAASSEDSSETTTTESTVALLAYVSGLLEDLTGQIRMAYSQSTHFNKWGTHYLPSLRCAHQYQQCNNFKDPGVQHYGGGLFRAIRDSAEEVFLSLPPPKPSRNTRHGYASSAPVNMSTFHNASAGCFAGSGRVTMADGLSTKLVCELQPGDRVQCGDEFSSADKNIIKNTDIDTVITAAVECVVRTKCSNSRTAEFVKMPNGLLLTPWHPVWYDGAWQFPMDVTGCSKIMPADYVYNFVLGSSSSGGRGQSMLVDGVRCITLAHGIEKDSVATHAFYGTEEVLKSLREYDEVGYAEGNVVMDECHVQRSEDSGLVCGFGGAQQQEQQQNMMAD